MKDRIILLGLNELNFDFIRTYIDRGELKNFKRLFNEFGYVKTTSEKKYELLEPWIQWVTIHTGKTYEEHNVFRLGDIVGREDLTQLWEVAESKGLSVAAVSPFNADNRLNEPLFFVPDPWTKTKIDGPPLIKKVAVAVSQAVNDNAQSKLSASSGLSLLRALVKYVPAKKYGSYLKQLFKIRKTVGVKAVILDKLLADIFVSNWKKYQPGFSSLFLNTGAHVQHHYMFNSSSYSGEFKNPEWYCPADQDPLFEILKEYDAVIGELLSLNVRLFIATGLNQRPHKHLTFYWRLKEHELFLKMIGVSFTKVIPRMSRDFLIEFDNAKAAEDAALLLDSFTGEKDDKKIFKIDNRGNSLFVELIYSLDITDSFAIKSNLNNQVIREFKKYVAFVAIKNGEHDEMGFFVDTNVNKKATDGTAIPLTSVYDIISASF